MVLLAVCPSCGVASVRRHSSYRRRLADAAVGGQAVEIVLEVRRLFCDAPACPQVTFAEQVDGLTERCQRRTPLLRRLLTAIGIALSGLPGARLAALPPAVVSPTTMLSLVMRAPDPPTATPRVLGVDDFAFKRSYVYGSILVDCETGAPVDLLEDREADTFARWLAAREGIEAICRDRAGAYAASAAAAPDAVQIADRWHVWKNLCDTVEKAVATHRTCLIPPEEPQGTPAVTVAVEGIQAANARRRHAEVHALYDRGVRIGRIAEELGLDRKTVRRYAHAATAEDMITTPRRGPRGLARYAAYLNQRWSEACTDSRRLFRELQELGYRGSASSIRRWLEPLRGAEPTLRRLPEAPTVRCAAAWLTRHPDGLTSEEAIRLKQLPDRCPELTDTAYHVREFAKIMDRLEGERRLPAWIDAAEHALQPVVRNFALNLRNDIDAVIQGLTGSFNSGVVEVRVTDLKSIKRQMAGRAGFELLRKRVLLVAASRRPPTVTSDAIR